MKSTILLILICTFLSMVSCGEEETCCKTCSTGKACGDSCISTDKSCDVGPGCACDS